MMSDFDFEKGEIILFDKPYQWSSFDVVNKSRIAIKRFCNKKIKVGHAGTLDPLATGLVIVCTGAFTKKIEEIQGHVKEYIGTFTLGANRPSCDKETDVNETFDYSHVTENQIFEVAKSFLGEQMQVPPIFSAVKVDGVRAYRFARVNDNEDVVEPKLPPRPIIIYEFEITKINMPDVDFRIVCSKGTYIRSIARDFGTKLGCGAFLEELRRTAIGDFRVENALDLYDFEQLLKDVKD